ncbi:MAG: T9SS type A sorting domain-containing protein [Cytophagales bacterium]|nr:T9SS type A sorting domain-containing protein [Cytophagales bacterium]
MKRNYLIFLFTILTTYSWADTLSIFQNNTSSITIDGNLSEWEAIEATSAFILHDTGKDSKQQTTAKVTWDSENIYFAFDVKDQNIVGSDQERDSPLFGSDDLIEVFIDPDGDGQNYLEFGVNAYGNIYDYVLICVSSSCGGWKDNQGFTVQDIETATTIDGTVGNSSDIDTGFTVEVKVPFSSLTSITNGNFSTPDEGDSWRVNLFRVDYTPNAAIEYQSWTAHNSFGYHQPSKFGYFNFSTKVTEIQEEVQNTQLWSIENNMLTSFSAETIIQVINTQGQVIDITSDNGNYDLTVLNKGIYFIHSQNGEVYTTEKILID